MTGTTGADDLCMVDRKYRHPDVRRMTVLAEVAGLYVRRPLTSGIRAVMAAKAIARDIDVIEIGGQPGNR
jgi:hypothetical protein